MSTNASLLRLPITDTNSSINYITSGMPINSEVNIKSLNIYTGTVTLYVNLYNFNVGFDNEFTFVNRSQSNIRIYLTQVSPDIFVPILPNNLATFIWDGSDYQLIYDTNPTTGKLNDCAIITTLLAAPMSATALLPLTVFLAPVNTQITLAGSGGNTLTITNNSTTIPLYITAKTNFYCTGLSAPLSYRVRVNDLTIFPSSINNANSAIKFESFTTYILNPSTSTTLKCEMVTNTSTTAAIAANSFIVVEFYPII